MDGITKLPWQHWTQWCFCFCVQKKTARFPEISGEEIQKLDEKAVNKNTVKTTKKWRNVWTSWAESKGLNDDIVKYEAKELEECLLRLFAEIRKSDGSDYEPDSLRVMLAALDRHLKQNDNKISIAKDQDFVKCRQVLKGKARALREKRPRKTAKCKKSTYRSRWRAAMVKPCTWRTKSIVNPSYSVVSAWSSRLPRAPWNVCRRFQLEQGRPRHRVRNI